ncbi:M23 family metallopeptidase [Terricaulis sp.]|uniref:M23 family metallopeptidase n=1 Tax=Terricaulis sp. TaxID=2768686 RepID=UPI003783AA5F
MKLTFCAALAALLAFAGSADALEVKFYPADYVYAYELDRAHGSSSVILHNIAIVNDGPAPVTLNAVSIELMAGERTIDARTLGAEELSRAAAGGAGLQQAGLLQPLAFQFGGDLLLPANTTLSADLTLDPGEAILISSQVFAYRGARDGVRVRVNGDAAQGRIAIRSEGTQTRFSFPLHGRWWNAAGSSFHTHHRWTPMEEFAFDLIRLRPDLTTHRRDGTRFGDYLAYGEPVFAAAPGRVALVISGEQEDASVMQRPDETIETYFARLQQEQMTRLARGAAGIGGNQIMIDHGNGEFSFYGHLQPGSVLVRVGDQVMRGQRIAAVGSSGNSTEPHLHFHVCNSADPLMCRGIPITWEGEIDLGMPDPPRAPQTGDIMSQH